MNKKFMKVRRIVVPTLTLIIMASQFMGCAATTQEETMKMLENNKEVEIEVAELDDEYTDTANKKSNTESVEPIEWTELASLETVPEMRNAWDEITLANESDTGKGGKFYINSKGEVDSNNTLREAILADTGSPLKYNVEEAQKLYMNKIGGGGGGSKETMETLAGFASDYYADIDSKDVDTAFLAGLNAYFNLLPDSEQGKANMDESITRKEFMAMVYRADTPVQELAEDKDFTKAVGESEYNVYAQNLKNNSYLTIESGDLNSDTYNSAISRAEAVYMIVNRYYRDELLQTCQREDVKGSMYVYSQDENGNISTGELTEITFKDAKQNTVANENTLESLNEAIKDPDSGMPKYLYGSLIVAAQHEIIDIGQDTRWDESITKEETLQLLVNVYECMSRAMDKDNIPTADTEEFVTNEQQEEAELQAAYDRYNELRAKGEKVDGATCSQILLSMPEGERGNRGGMYVGYDLITDEQGLHALKSVINGEVVHIGECIDTGEQYMGETDCREDMIHWYRLCNPNTNETDDEIAAMYGLD